MWRVYCSKLCYINGHKETVFARKSDEAIAKRETNKHREIIRAKRKSSGLP